MVSGVRMAAPPFSSTATLTRLRYFAAASAPLRMKSSYRRRQLGADEAVDPLTKNTPIDKGSLHVVSVPIGNLKDFSFRAIEVLEGVDYVVTSDRPATKTLLDLVNIPSQGRLIHFSRSNQTATCAKLVELLRGGRSMALVTTSGTPCVGDIGASLVQEMQAGGVRVTAVPGASAVISALTVCGVTGSRFDPENTADREARATAARADGGGDGGGVLSKSALRDLRDGSFFFGNMLPSSHGERLRLLRNTVAPAHFPCVFYEVPRRLLMVLQDIAAVLPKRRVFVCHELTKMNESLHADTAERLVAFYLRQEAQIMLKKGELVLVIAGAGPEEAAAWMEREAAKRRRMRRSVRDLMGIPAAAAALRPPTPSDAVAVDSKAAKRAKKRKVGASKRTIRRTLLNKKRERLIREIELEQERLRLNVAIQNQSPGLGY